MAYMSRQIYKRIITGTSLILYMIIALYYGVPFILISALLIQLKCVDEVIQLAFKIKKIPSNSNFRYVTWYLIFIANYLFTGDMLSKHMKVYLKRYQVLDFVYHYYRFTSFCLYLFGMLWFLTVAREKSIRQQFSVLFWTHFLIIILACPTYLIVQNVFEGIIWVMLPLGVVILNDMFSYVFGTALGKTPLILVSPNKTWEGLILGGVFTVIFGPILGYLFSLSDHLVCPVAYREINNEINLERQCSANDVLQLHSYEVGNTGYFINVTPLTIHSIVFSLFASGIGPFGGFFASGFKRAIGVKNFSGFIPGHGGLMDRFDCQFLMAIFAKVYVCTFIRTYSVEKVLQKIMSLGVEKQLEFYHLLESSLSERNFTVT